MKKLSIAVFAVAAVLFLAWGISKFYNTDEICRPFTLDKKSYRLDDNITIQMNDCAPASMNKFGIYRVADDTNFYVSDRIIDQGDAIFSSDKFQYIKTLRFNVRSFKAQPFVYKAKPQIVFSQTGTYRFILGENLHTDSGVFKTYEDEIHVDVTDKR